MHLYSVIVVRLVESNTVVCINDEIAGVDVVSLHDHFEDLRLVHSTLLHEIYDLILYHNSVINVVVKLNLQFILKLTCLVQEFLIFNGFCEILVVLSEEVEFANVCP